MVLLAIAGQFHRIGKGTAWMARHQVRHHILIFSYFLIDCRKFFAKTVKHLPFGFAHIIQHPFTHMLRRHPQLPADMVLAQLPQKAVVLVGQQVIIPDTGTHKHFFDAGQFSQPRQKRAVFPVGNLHILARLRKQALPVLTAACLQLLFTGRR